jgi:hypothetical protein
VTVYLEWEDEETRPDRLSPQGNTT